MQLSLATIVIFVSSVALVLLRIARASAGRCRTGAGVVHRRCRNAACVQQATERLDARQRRLLVRRVLWAPKPLRNRCKAWPVQNTESDDAISHWSAHARQQKGAGVARYRLERRHRERQEPHYGKIRDVALHHGPLQGKHTHTHTHTHTHIKIIL